MDKPIIVALDYLNQQDVLQMADCLSPELCRVKVGKALFVSVGPSIIKQLHQRGFEVFLDLKFHDIPNTVNQAIKSVADLGVWLTNIHLLGGEKMIQSAKKAIEGYQNPPKLIGVTVLTSFNQEDLNKIGLNQSIDQLAVNLAITAKQNGLDGVVCSAREARLIKQNCGLDFITVTPGIRLEIDERDDQERIVTPKNALQNGSDYLVIGRPITKSINPKQKLADILKDLS